MLNSVFVVALLSFAFAVLVVTFLWIARLMAMRASKRSGRARATRESVDGPGPPDPGAAADSAAADADPPGEESEQEEPDRTGVAVVVSSRLGLILGVLACLLFKLSPLLIILSVAGMYYSAGAIWGGLRRYRIVMYRAVVGLLLSVLSVGLHFLELTGQFSALWRVIVP